MKTPFSLALRKARPLIASGQYTWICSALQDTGGAKFCQRIMAQLNGFPTYVVWVERSHPKAYAQMNRIGSNAFIEAA